jgi:hypothetical protein
MPIRTNRGRAAVYRRLWGWPLRSPRHLVVALIALVVVAIAIGVIAARTHGTPRPGVGGGATLGTSVSTTINIPTATAGFTTSAAPITRLSGPPVPPSSVAPNPAALDVIQTWGKAWVNHPVGMTTQAWLAQLAPYTTQEFLPVMNSVDVTNISATQVTGAPQVTKSFPQSVEALLPTNGGQLDITAIDTPTGWLVSAYTKAS